jgi:hypothetical protein
MTGRVQEMMIVGMQHFVDDDRGYLEWLSAHPDGFVLNTYTRPSASYLRLHSAACRTISVLQPPGTTFTEGDYSKLCGGRSELEEHARRLGGPAQPCTRCL